MASNSSCFEEARRRYESFAVRDGKTLLSGWLGLGTPSEYRTMLAKGFVTPLHGRITPRALNWWCLTPAGVEEYRRRFPGSENLSQRKYENGLEIEHG